MRGLFDYRLFGRRRGTARVDVVPSSHDGRTDVDQSTWRLHGDHAVVSKVVCPEYQNSQRGRVHDADGGRNCRWSISFSDSHGFGWLNVSHGFDIVKRRGFREDNGWSVGYNLWNGKGLKYSLGGFNISNLHWVYGGELREYRLRYGFPVLETANLESKRIRELREFHRQSKRLTNGERGSNEENKSSPKSTNSESSVGNSSRRRKSTARPHLVDIHPKQ